MHDGKAEAAEFGLLNKFPQHKSIPHEPRICLQHSTDTVILPPPKYMQIHAPCSSVGMQWGTDRHTQTDRHTHRHTCVTNIHFTSSMTHAKFNQTATVCRETKTAMLWTTSFSSLHMLSTTISQSSENTDISETAARNTTIQQHIPVHGAADAWSLHWCWQVVARCVSDRTSWRNSSRLCRAPRRPSTNTACCPASTTCNHIFSTNDSCPHDMIHLYSNPSLT